MEINFSSPCDGVASLPAVTSIPDIDLDIDLVVDCEFVYEPGEAQTAISPGVDESVSVSSIRILSAGRDVCAGVLPMLQFSAEIIEAEILKALREKRDFEMSADKNEEAHHASF